MATSGLFNLSRLPIFIQSLFSNSINQVWTFHSVTRSYRSFFSRHGTLIIYVPSFLAQSYKRPFNSSTMDWFLFGLDGSVASVFATRFWQNLLAYDHPCFLWPCKKPGFHACHITFTTLWVEKHVATYQHMFRVILYMCLFHPNRKPSDQNLNLFLEPRGFFQLLCCLTAHFRLLSIYLAGRLCIICC